MENKILKIEKDEGDTPFIVTWKDNSKSRYDTLNQALIAIRIDFKFN